MPHGTKISLAADAGGAGRRPARDDVNPARDRRCAETVSRRRHARMAAPACDIFVEGCRLSATAIIPAAVVAAVAAMLVVVSRSALSLVVVAQFGRARACRKDSGQSQNSTAAAEQMT